MRWLILAVLFLARMTMSFQFESVAALAPLVAGKYDFSIADIGVLIGLYLAPGVAVAIPGGAIASRFGDKRVVVLSMILMLVGCAMMTWAPDWRWIYAGRLLSGAGGVVINIVMSKMLMDWFVGHEISTAMAIFVNSWPVGIALALLTIPPLATRGLMFAWLYVLAVIFVGLMIVALVYRPSQAAANPAAGVVFTKLPMRALLLSAIAWALYNAAFAMVFSFGPVFLVERGWLLTSASYTTSAFILVVAVAVPIGGILADWSGRRDAVILTSLMSYILLLPMVLVAPSLATLPIFMVVGLIFGLAAGPIISLPALVLKPENRALGMGVYYSIYYAVMMLTPAVGGKIAERSGSVGATFVFGALMLVATLLALFGYRRSSGSVHIPV